MNTREKERQDALEYVVDDNGKRHFVFPMKLKDRRRVEKLFGKVNDEYPILNMPMQALDKNGIPMVDDDGEPVMNEEPYEAMMELLELALHESRESMEEWIDIGMVAGILDGFRDMSGLKKKMMATTNPEMMKRILTGIPSMQD